MVDRVAERGPSASLGRGDAFWNGLLFWEFSSASTARLHTQHCAFLSFTLNWLYSESFQKGHENVTVQKEATRMFPVEDLHKAFSLRWSSWQLWEWQSFPKSQHFFQLTILMFPLCISIFHIIYTVPVNLNCMCSAPCMLPPLLRQFLWVKILLSAHQSHFIWDWWQLAEQAIKRLLMEC